MITTLGFTTRDRPDYLDRCVDSFIRSCRSFGRTPRLLIMDDAVLGGHASARPVAERIARQHPDLDVGYAGAPEKRAFIDALVEKGLPADVIEFALADPERCGYTLGANRNALQLATVGEQVMYIDDDCLAVTARPPAWRRRAGGPRARVVAGLLVLRRPRERNRGGDVHRHRPARRP